MFTFGLGAAVRLSRARTRADGPRVSAETSVRRSGAHRVAAVDPTPPFVEACRSRNPGADIRQAAAESLPFADGEFDAALASLVVGFMKEPTTGSGRWRA